MIKDKLRFLALGFFLSAGVLSAYNLLLSPQEEQGIGVEDVDASTAVNYQKKYEDLLVEHELLKNSVSSSTAESDSSDESVSHDEVAEPEVEEVADSSSEEESVPESSNQIVFVVHEGQPSSVVLESLLAAGLIDDIEGADNYLRDNNLTEKLQIGSYDLSRDMGYEVIIDSITME